MPNSSDVLVERLLAMVRPRRIEWATKCGRSFRSDLQHRYSGIEFSRRDSAGGRVLYKRCHTTDCLAGSTAQYDGGSSNRGCLGRRRKLFRVNPYLNPWHASP
jgi:hypothetical protein